MTFSVRVTQVLALWLTTASLAASFTVGGGGGPQQQLQRRRLHSRSSNTFLRDGEQQPGGTSSSPWGGAGPSNGNVGSIETLEFKIYPDGRVEETVRGVKGGSCTKVTEKINEALGKVVQTAPTEEMFEQDIVVDQTLTQTDGGGSDWDGSTPNSW